MEKKSHKAGSQKALAALALALSAGHAAPAIADEVDLRTLQLLKEESISEQAFYAAYGKRPSPRKNGGGSYSRGGLSSGNYSRGGLSSSNYSRGGLSAASYSRGGLSASNYSRGGISAGNYSRGGLTGSRFLFEEGREAAMPAPSVSFEEGDL